MNKKINFMRLLKTASLKAHQKLGIDEEYHFVSSILDKNGQIKLRFDLNTLDNSITQIQLDDEIRHSEFSEIRIDYRYLYGLLTTVYHWNNAEVGSQYFTNRYPLNNFKRKVQGYLNFLALA